MNLLVETASLFSQMLGALHLRQVESPFQIFHKQRWRWENQQCRRAGCHPVREEVSVSPCQPHPKLVHALRATHMQTATLADSNSSSVVEKEACVSPVPTRCAVNSLAAGTCCPLVGSALKTHYSADPDAHPVPLDLSPSRHVTLWEKKLG